MISDSRTNNKSMILFISYQNGCFKVAVLLVDLPFVSLALQCVDMSGVSQYFHV